MRRKHCHACSRTLVAARFHKRAASLDGLSAKCKDCQRTYDAARLHKPDRVAARKAYANTEKGRERLSAGKAAWIERNPEKRGCHITFNNALRDGKVQRAPCQGCGAEKAHAHHADYSKPLEIEWLCRACHTELHKSERRRA